MNSMKKLSAAILTTATMAMFSSGVNALTISVVDSSPKIVGQSFSVTIDVGEDEQPPTTVTIKENGNSIEELPVNSNNVTPTKIAQNATVCVGDICSNSFTIRPDSFEFKLRKGIDSTDYGNSSFENSDQDKDPFAGQKVYLEVTPRDVNGNLISNTCNKKDQLALKLKTIKYSNGFEEFTANDKNFQFFPDENEKISCDETGSNKLKLYIPFRFLDFGLLTLTNESFSSELTNEIKIKDSPIKVGIFKAAYVYFEGTLTPIQTSPDGLNYMGQPFDTRLVYTAYPQTGDEKAEIDKSTKLESYTYDGNNKKYMFTVGLTKAFDSDNNCYPITDGSTKEEDKCKEEKIIAGYDTSNTDIYSELLRNKERQWEKGEIIFDSLNNGTTPTDETIKYRLRYIRPAKPIEPQTISVFGGVVDGDIPGVPKQASNPQPATKGEAGPIIVSFGRLRFTDIMHYDKDKLKVKVIPQKWENSTWVDAGDEHTKKIINDKKFFGMCDKDLKSCSEKKGSFYFEEGNNIKGNPATALADGFLKVNTDSDVKKVETYVCVNLGKLAENGDLNDDKDVCTTGVTPANVPWLKGIWKVTETETKYNQNPRAHVYYGLKYSAEKEKTVYTRELW